MIKGALIFLITLNLIGCNMKTKISNVSQSHSNQNNSTSYIGNYLTANYSIMKGDAYTASRILDRNLSSLRFFCIVRSRTLFYSLNPTLSRTHERCPIKLMKKEVK